MGRPRPPYRQAGPNGSLCGQPGRVARRQDGLVQVSQALFERRQLDLFEHNGLLSPNAVPDEAPVSQGGRSDALGSLARILEL